MTAHIEPRHDLSPNEIDAIEDRIYDHNSYATERHDGQGLGFVIRNEAGQMIGVSYGAPTEFRSNGRIIRWQIDWKPGDTRGHITCH